MRAVLFSLGLILLVSLCTPAFAQRGGGCQSRGGGEGRGAMVMRGEGPRNYVSQLEIARQYSMRLQQQEVAKAYFKQVQEAELRATEQQEAKRQDKIEAIKARRAAEIARREATKARNLAKRSGSRELATNK